MLLGEVGCVRAELQPGLVLLQLPQALTNLMTSRVSHNSTHARACCCGGCNQSINHAATQRCAGCTGVRAPWWRARARLEAR